MQIGITGGIGSGKSLVCKIFHVLGVPVYDADSRAKAIMTTDGILIDQIKKEFGSLSFRNDGSLNREYLSSVFNDPEKLKKLNSLVHPRVAQGYIHWVNHQSYPYVIKEAALLFEAGSNRNLNYVIVVAAPEELRIKRVLERDTHRTQEQVRAIIENQMDEGEKVKLADFVINNDEGELLIPQVLQLHQKFVKAS